MGVVLQSIGIMILVAIMTTVIGVLLFYGDVLVVKAWKKTVSIVQAILKKL